MAWWLADREQTSTGKVSGPGRESAPGPLSFREGKPCEGSLTKAETQERLLLLQTSRHTTRNGLLIVKASGFMPASTLDQVTGAAIGNLSRARGE